jgi:hypothetical protein
VGLEGEDAFFHRFFRYQVIHQHGTILSEAMGTISRLLLDGRVPPGIEQKHMISGSEIEAEPAGSEGNEHHRGALCVLETVHHSGSISCRSVQPDKTQPGCLQMWLDAIEEGRPLRKDECLVPCSDYLLQRFQEQRDL